MNPEAQPPIPISSSAKAAADDDFGEEVYRGKVRAATLPPGGPASRRFKKEVQGGPVAKG